MKSAKTFSDRWCLAMNIERMKKDIRVLSGFTEPCEKGITRPSYTASYRRAIDYLKREMAQAGLQVHEDGIGNLYGKLPGQNSLAATIISGSHIDTVRCGGAYDGIAGVVCALEAARTLKGEGCSLEHPFEVMGIVEEEGTRFGHVMMGSQFVTGSYDASRLNQFFDADGISLESALKGYLGNVDLSDVCRKGENVSAYVELHIEQGPLLEESHTDIGIVENIVGISVLSVTIRGVAGHAGTLPMDLRRDAGLGAFRLILDGNNYVLQNYTGRATITVGHFHLEPDSANVVPGKCVFTVDIRSGDEKIIDNITRYFQKISRKLEKESGLGVEIETLTKKKPVALDHEYQDIIQESCKNLGYTCRKMDSGAGHDAMNFAGIWRSAMIFIPCRKGITHHPDEFVEDRWLENGAEVLFETIRQIDRIASQTC